MLLSFSVSNFRSFRDEQTLTMVASNRHSDHADHLSTIPDDSNQVLPVAAIYGANGAGKSNLVRGMEFLQELIEKGTAPKKMTGRQAFLLDKTSSSDPTRFSIQFVNNGKVFAFGAAVTDRNITEEWLSVVRSGKELLVYERITDSENHVTIKAGSVLSDSSWGDHPKVVALSNVGVLPNQLFLHAISQTLTDEDQGPVIRSALLWFTKRLVIVSPESYYRSLVQLVARDADFANFAGDFHRKVATGVNALRVETSEMDDFAMGSLPKGMQEAISELPVGDTTAFGYTDGSGREIVVEKGEGTKIFSRTMKAEHLTADGDAVRFPFAEESDGTKRITQLLPALHSGAKAKNVFVIDEIDRSLHPLLAKGFVRAFLKTCVSDDAQLIFTTHDTNFLDLDLLRRDEIWFADKRRLEGNTQLYSLAEYGDRTDIKIDKAYLQGRFEAVPPIETELPDWVHKIMDELRPRVSIDQHQPLDKA